MRLLQLLAWIGLTGGTVLAVDAAVLNTKALNDRPIIGILSQNLPSSLDYLSPGGTYIAASYVKWIEAAGGRVVPLIAGSNQNFSQLFSSLNGVLFPGGSNSIYSGNYHSVGQEMFDLAKAANDKGDVFPIWGTCLGYEMLVLLANAGQRYLASCSATNIHLPLTLVEGWENSRLYGQASGDVIDAVTTQPITANFHVWCLTPTNFTLYEMGKFWRPLSVNTDKNGLEFISSLEALEYPFYGSQYHPEKNSFEWTTNYPDMAHTSEAVSVANYLAQFFMREARRSAHKFPSRSEEEANLIQNYSPLYVGKEEIGSNFQQIYIFPQ